MRPAYFCLLIALLFYNPATTLGATRSFNYTHRIISEMTVTLTLKPGVYEPEKTQLDKVVGATFALRDDALEYALNVSPCSTTALSKWEGTGLGASGAKVSLQTTSGSYYSGDLGYVESSLNMLPGFTNSGYRGIGEPPFKSATLTLGQFSTAYRISDIEYCVVPQTGGTPNIAIDPRAAMIGWVTKVGGSYGFEQIPGLITGIYATPTATEKTLASGHYETEIEITELGAEYPFLSFDTMDPKRMYIDILSSTSLPPIEVREAGRRLCSLDRGCGFRPRGDGQFRLRAEDPAIKNYNGQTYPINIQMTFE